MFEQGSNVKVSWLPPYAKLGKKLRKIVCVSPASTQICRGFKEHARPNHMLVESSSRRFPRKLGPVRMELREGDLRWGYQSLHTTDFSLFLDRVHM